MAGVSLPSPRPLAFLCSGVGWLSCGRAAQSTVYYLMQNEMFILAERMLLWCLFLQNWFPEVRRGDRSETSAPCWLLWKEEGCTGPDDPGPRAPSRSE